MLGKGHGQCHAAGMKIKTISRSEEAFTRECKGDVVKVFRNLDPALHPFDKAREYTRALQATKLDKVFAKPLVGTWWTRAWLVSSCAD